MTRPDESEQQLVEQLRSVVSKYIEQRVTNPAIETVSENILGQARLTSLLSLADLIIVDSRKHGITYDKEFLEKLPVEEIEARISALGAFIESEGEQSEGGESSSKSAMEYLKNDDSKIYLNEYLGREIHWASISLLSASYISSLVLMRSVFELIIGIATRETGGMKERIESISILSVDEQKKTKKLWYRLCAWGHPYGKWFSEVCPAYVAHKPIFHPRLFDLCLKELTEIIDFYAAVATNKFDLDRERVRAKLIDRKIDYEDLNIFTRVIDA